MHHHTALAYETTEEFLAGAVPFISAALARERAVIAIAAPSRVDALREAVGSAAAAVEFTGTDSWYASQARAFSQFVERARALQDEGRPGLCILTDPSVAGFDEEQVRRWLFVENAVNDVLPELPISVMCTYDLRASGLTREQIEVAHPHMARGGGVCMNRNFIEPRDFNTSHYAVARAVATSDAATVDFERMTLAPLRSFVERTALELALSAPQAADLVIAAAEAAANAVEHGGGRGVARMWRIGCEVVCEIENAGARIANTRSGFVTPSLAAERGRGIWLMRQLCDWVDLSADGEGTSVRLHMRDQS